MRHEEKFICSERQLLLLEKRLSVIMESDVNQSGNDYRIRSLYFDTFDDRFYNECLNGVDKRSKYRIRFYNMDDSFFRAERKDTVGALKHKYSSAVTREYVAALLSDGNIPDSDDRVTAQMHAMQLTDGLHPVIVIDYRRTAFTYPLGNIRITFDRDICCTARTDELLDPNALLYPVMPQGKHVLEVKYDNILPGFIRRVLDAEAPGRISFSKYAYSRSIIDGNGRKEDGYDI